MLRLPHRLASALVAALVLLASPPSLKAQGSEQTSPLGVINAPPALAQVTDRVRRIDRQQIADALTRAGLAMPSDIRVELIPESDSRAGDVPRWIVGLASGSHCVGMCGGIVAAFDGRRVIRIHGAGGAEPAWPRRLAFSISNPHQAQSAGRHRWSRSAAISCFEN